MLTAIKIAYLVEKSNKEPWFIGTEFCYAIKKVSEPEKPKSPEAV